MNEGLEALAKLRYFDEHTLIKDNKFRIMGELDIIESELKDFEWLKSKIGIDFFYNLPTEDRVKLAKILGVKL